MSNEIGLILERLEVGDGCWKWTGAHRSTGYGVWRGTAAHRVIYELLVGPIPEGLELDHLCHNADLTCPGRACPHRGCVNPAHLEPTTGAINRRRGRGNAAKTHCPSGHEYTPENTYYRKGRKSGRMCLKCSRRSTHAREKVRLATDPEFAQRKREANHASYLRHRDEALQRGAERKRLAREARKH